MGSAVHPQRVQFHELFPVYAEIVWEIIPWGWTSSPKKYKKKKPAQIDFLFLEQESEQESCHVGQTATEWFL